ncbi:DUF3127 domain-containing protein [Candidatus Pacearchaeota archaeon]|jgi:hypothetical protein|nr:DUF3127 domain-containing protein [Candidatus Pacearchaeota archaeon]
MKIEITGRVDEIKPDETRGTFTKRELWLTIDAGDKYPQQIAVEFQKQNAVKLDTVRQGDEVTVSADIRGREYNGRRYVSIVGWRVTINAGANARPQTPMNEGAAGGAGGGAKHEPEDGQIPF